MHAAVGGESHEVEALAGLAGIAVGCHDAGILHDGVVADGAVDFHQVLIDHATGSDVEVTHLGVAHLTVGKTHVLAGGLQLSVCAHCIEIVEVGSGCAEDDVAVSVLADAPAIEYHKKCFLCHNYFNF